jgi:HEAT repeat protein
MRVLLLVLLLFVPVPAPAQAPAARPGAMGVEESTLLTQAWAHLAQGNLAQAGRVLDQLRTAHPASVHTLGVGIEIDVAVAGAAAALEGYERWLGGRALEEPAALRRVARALLFELAVGAMPPALRVNAWAALAADGERLAEAALSGSANNGGLAEAAVLASRGNEAAVSRVIAALADPAIGNKLALVEALVKSGSAQARTPLVGMLKDNRPEHRAAAADGLARLGARNQIETIRRMVTEPNAPPALRIAAAGALLRFDDLSAINVLQDALRSPVAGMRLAGARALAERPDAEWLSAVRQLLQDSDPMIRLGAVELVAPHDPALARSTIDGLRADPNLAVREQAEERQVVVAGSDLRTLRALLRSTHTRARIDAADRILQLTR